MFDKDGDFDYKTHERKRKPILSYGKIAIIIVIGVLTISLYFGMSIASPKDDFQSEEFQCARWVEEGKFLIAKNLGKDQLELWSEEDRSKFLELDDKIENYCVAPKILVMGYLNQCTDYYIEIQTLLDKMVELEVMSLFPIEQQQYLTVYDEYFDLNCDVIGDEIIKTKKFLEFDKTRNE